MIFGRIILEKLSNRLVEYLENNLRLHIQNIGQVDNVQEINLSHQTACISISNPTNATIALSTSHKLSEILLKNFITGNISSEDMNEFSQICLAETLNIALGNIIKDLPQEYGNIDIASPYFLENQQIIYPTHTTEMYILKINIENEIMLVCYFT